MTDKDETAIAQQEPTSVKLLSEDGVFDTNRIKLIMDGIKRLMIEEMEEGIDQDYAVIPGCKKKSLLQPGATKIKTFIGCATRSISHDIIDMPNGHREYRTLMGMYDLTTNKLIGDCMGICSTMESKYRYRAEERKCPRCGQEAIIKGKQEYGGGWLCWKKTGGCGAKFSDNDVEITGQKVGRIDYEDPADYWNTCSRISEKRGTVGLVVRTVPGVSNFFTTEIDEHPELFGYQSPAKEKLDDIIPRETDATVEESTPTYTEDDFLTDDAPPDTPPPETIPPESLVKSDLEKTWEVIDRIRAHRTRAEVAKQLSEFTGTKNGEQVPIYTEDLVVNNTGGKVSAKWINQIRAKAKKLITNEAWNSDLPF